jgi:hypothetical protein
VPASWLELVGELVNAVVLKKNSMNWVQLSLYFVVWTVVLMAVLEGFAWLLCRVARLPRPFPLVLGLLLYGVVAGTFFLGILGLEILQGPLISHNQTDREVFLLGYLACWLIGILFFRHRHLDALRALGYFQSRTRR